MGRAGKQKKKYKCELLPMAMEMRLDLNLCTLTNAFAFFSVLLRCAFFIGLLPKDAGQDS